MSDDSLFDLAKQVLRTTFGYDDFRSYQAEVIQNVLTGGNNLVIMPTGMGKSLCFQIPAIVFAQPKQTLPSQAKPDPSSSPNVKRCMTLVLSPLIALMKDQVDALVAKGVSATFVNSSLQRNERLKRYEQIAQGQFDIVYVAPERFRKPDFCEVMQKRRVQLLAVDEAHCISEWGHDFRPDYTRVDEIRKELGSPPTIALTATATPEVQHDIVRQLGLEPDEIRLFHAGIERPNLSLNVRHVWDDDEKFDAVKEIRSRHTGSGIVYFTLIRKLREFSDRLWSENISHLVYHGDLDRRDRRQIQESFMDQPDHLVLATNAFGMGVDKEDIRFVLHCDLPDSLESYYQEIGRAGRDGQDSECILLYDQRDLATQMEFMKWSNPDSEFYQRVYDYLSHETEQVNAFGLEWLREKIHHKQKHDRRLETVLAMLFRWGVIEGEINHGFKIRVVDELPARLKDATLIDAKLKRDQTKLLNMVQYVNHDGDRKAFIHDYFGVGVTKDNVNSIG
jgi:ATP-dependent DNA helicase RecQ